MTAESGWEAATFDGLRELQHRDVAAVSPLARMLWLEEALQLAERSGALAVARRRRQRECDELWRQSGPAPS